jgi:2-polyprenyl-6-methoxyphenol hydroxylase-like FAD-dependent oxidoreductase
VDVTSAEIAIVGGGQAGLALSYHLTARGRSHVILEQRRTVESWRSLFVALSIHLKAVLEHPLLKPRAVLALTVLATQIVITLGRTMASAWALLTALE